MSEQQAEIKRFVAPTMSRALELVRDEMGPEAIILSSKKVPGGIEIVTSIELDLPTRGISERRDFGQNFDTELDQALHSDDSWQAHAGIEQAATAYAGKVEHRPEPAPAKRLPGEDIAKEIERARERMLAAKRAAADAEAGTTQPVRDERISHRQRSNAKHDELVAHSRAQADQHDHQLDSMRSELADLRMLFEQQMWAKEDNDYSDVSGSPQSQINPNISAEYGSPYSSYRAEPVTAEFTKQGVLDGHLSRLGLSRAIIQDLLSRVEPRTRVSDGWKQSLASLSKRIPVAAHINTQRGGVFAFMGPTGVGKTTSLAKLAAQFSIAHGPGKVAIVSMDTFRVGAVEQLKALGRILEAPVKTVDESHSLMTTLAGLKGFPLVLIDTAGFRHGDPKLKAQLRQLDENPSVKRMLVLSSLSQLQTVKASIHAYRPRRDIDGCVISKLDEASSLGESISAILEHSLAVAYVTDGQQIPADIHAATGHRLVSSAVSLAKQHSILDTVSL